MIGGHPAPSGGTSRRTLQRFSATTSTARREDPHGLRQRHRGIVDEFEREGEQPEIHRPAPDRQVMGVAQYQAQARIVPASLRQHRGRAVQAHHAGQPAGQPLDRLNTHYLMSPSHVPNLKRLPREVLAAGRCLG